MGPVQWPKRRRGAQWPRSLKVESLWRQGRREPPPSPLCLYGLMWDGWRGFMGAMGGWSLTEKAEHQLKLIEDVNWQASRRREQSLVNKRECLRDRMWKRPWMSQHFFHTLCQSAFWPLGLDWGFLWVEQEGDSPEVAQQTNTTPGSPSHHQARRGGRYRNGGRTLGMHFSF